MSSMCRRFRSTSPRATASWTATTRFVGVAHAATGPGTAGASVATWAGTESPICRSSTLLAAFTGAAARAGRSGGQLKSGRSERDWRVLRNVGNSSSRQMPASMRTSSIASARMRPAVRAPTQHRLEGEAPADERVQHVMRRLDPVEHVQQPGRLLAVPGREDLTVQRTDLEDARLAVAPVIRGHALTVAALLDGTQRGVEGLRVVEHRRDGLAPEPPEPHRVTHALTDDRVLEVPGVPRECPPRAARATEEGRVVGRGAELGEVRRAAEPVTDGGALDAASPPTCPPGPCATAGCPPSAP